MFALDIKKKRAIIVHTTWGIIGSGRLKMIWLCTMETNPSVLMWWCGMVKGCKDPKERNLPKGCRLIIGLLQ